MLKLCCILIAFIAIKVSAIDRCFDGQFWMDPLAFASYSEAFCPDGYRLAALPTVQDHFKAAKLVYECKGGGQAAWIASTNGGATYGGELAIVAPKKIGAGATEAESVGGIIKASSGVLPFVCEHLQ